MSIEHGRLLIFLFLLSKKMVAVESYVKNHYGRGLTATEAQKSRAPLFPNDIDMGN